MTMPKRLLCLGLMLWSACTSPMPIEPSEDMGPPPSPDLGGRSLLASAGPDQTVTVGDRVMLMGTSNAPPGAMVVYRWSLEARPSGSSTTLTSAGDRAELVPEVVGDYLVRLEVFDGKRTSAPAPVTIHAQARMVKDDVPSGVFDPAEVYIFGTIAEGSCGRDAVAHVSNPEVAAAGFDCYVNERGSQIRPDGRLLYTNTFEDLLREFHCDDCPGWGRGKPYPSGVLANDPKLATKPCDTVSAFLVGVTGDRLHACKGAWYDEAGRVLPLTQPLSYGYHDKVLTATAVVDIKTGQTAPIMGLPSGILTTRVAGPTGFWVAVATSPEPELWEVSEDGSVKRLTPYAAPPAGYRAGAGARLDGRGNLYQEGDGPMTFEDIVLYRGLDGTSKVVYTEASNPFVKLHISSLVTGP